MVERREKRQIFQVSVNELAEVNPQTAIYNTVSYQDMVSSFAPELYDPIQLARVQIGQGEESQIIWGVVDGHTKTRFAIDHEEEYGMTHVDAYDSTQALLANPRIATAVTGGQTALTMEQYLRAVVERTRVHQEIAPRRIAAHLINGWESMVGSELASKFSATAAMNILSNNPIRDNLWLLENSLRKTDKLVPAETPEERKTLERAILQMNAIFQESKLKVSEVHKEAFSLVASMDPIIGGEKQAIAEIYGLLNLPSITSKIKNETKDETRQKIIQEELGKVALEALRLSQPANANGDPLIISKVLQDKDLTINETVEMLSNDNIKSSYDTLKVVKRQEALIEILSKQLEGNDISETELTLIARFSEMDVRQEDLPNIAKAVQNSGQTLRHVQQLIDNLTNDSNDFTSLGVKQSTINKSVEELTSHTQSLVESGSHHQLKLRDKELKTIIEYTTERLRHDKLTQTAYNLLNENIFPVLANSFKGESIPSMVENTAVAYLLENHKNELSIDESAKALMEKMKYLDGDLILKIFDSKITLPFALQLQRERGKNVPQQVFIENGKRIPQEVIDSQNGELERELPNWLETLSMNELDPKNMTNANKQIAWEIVKKLVKMINGHPDAERIIEDYPNLLRKLTELQERSTLD